MAVVLADLKARIESDLDDTTLTRILDAAVQATERSAGKAATQTTVVDASGLALLPVSRRITSITTLKERRTFYSDEVTLAADDYRVIGAYEILRLADGTNPASTWGAYAEVVYVPEVDQDIRDRVALDLSQIDAEFRAFDQEKVGDWSGLQKDYKSRRRELLAQIREGSSTIL